MPRFPILDGSNKIVKAQLPALAKADVGLSNVDNTRDQDKPVSAATTAAIAAAVASIPSGGGGLSGTLISPGIFRLATASTGGGTGGTTARATWKSGVYPRKIKQVAIDFGTLRGKPVDMVTTFMDRSSWAAILNVWYLGYVPAGANAAVAVPMWPQDGNVAAAANGTYDANWTTFATQIRDAGFPNAVIRLGWECNVEDMFWKATPSNVAQWVAAFKRARDRIKAVAPGMVINWNVNTGVSGPSCIADATQAYPGDAYVDEIGLDMYDWWPAYTATNWDARFNPATYGTMGYWLAFAEAHGKKFSMPEWGLAKTTAQGGGDNPLFINKVYSALQANASNVSWEAYYAENDSEFTTPIIDFTPTNTPNAWAEYKSWFTA